LLAADWTGACKLDCSFERTFRYAANDHLHPEASRDRFVKVTCDPSNDIQCIGIRRPLGTIV
jgi:hypothetical protein